jgi:hypothetical protein
MMRVKRQEEYTDDDVRADTKMKTYIKQHQTILDVFLKALTEHYATDSLAPGIVVAWLPDRCIFYCSVRRYSPHNFAMQSNIIVKAVSTLSADSAIHRAMQKWKQEILKPRQSNFDLFMAEDQFEYDERLK